MFNKKVYRFILRRQFFNGQDRIFNFLFSRNKFGNEHITTKPIEGNFQIKCDTRSWIGAKIVFTGDYEPALKKVFKDNLKEGDRVLDVGANIGFHTLYFAELVGETGKVTAFEPVPQNFEALTSNLSLNNFGNIETKNMALGNKNEQINIHADINSPNPGTFNLFDKDGNVKINCWIGDEIIKDETVDFIKIDVEGYESFVIEGLLKTIEKNKPKIVFEYDKDYHKKTGLPIDHIFRVLEKMDYRFLYVTKNGLAEIGDLLQFRSGNILAFPHA